VRNGRIKSYKGCELQMFRLTMTFFLAFGVVCISIGYISLVFGVMFRGSGVRVDLSM